MFRTHPVVLELGPKLEREMMDQLKRNQTGEEGVADWTDEQKNLGLPCRLGARVNLEVHTIGSKQLVRSRLQETAP